MTTPPKYFQLATKDPFVFDSGSRPARALGRARQIKIALGHVIPTVETWPYATDSNGQSYPAGTVGVRIAWVPGLDDTTEVGAVASFRALIPVPSELPAGYTARLARDHNYFPGSGGSMFGQAWLTTGFSPLPPYHAGAACRIRLADGLHDYAASLPESHGEDAYSAFFPSTAWSDYPTAGFRYVQLALGQELRCYADGHKGTSGADLGDTVLLTGTGAIQVGPMFAPGEKRFIRYPTGTIKAGPRVDLPLPFLTSGPGIVVPGGYVAAKLDVALPT